MDDVDVEVIYLLVVGGIWYYVLVVEGLVEDYCWVCVGGEYDLVVGYVG